MIALQTGQEVELFNLLLDIGRILGILGVVGLFGWLYWKSRPKQ